MRIAFYTIGCKVNQYETQALKEAFAAAGYRIVGEEDEADVYVINTCTVTNLADRKSRQYIRRAKKRNPAAVVAAVGCYVQMNPEEAASIREIDLLAGTNEKAALPAYLEAFLADRTKDRSHVLPLEELVSYEETGPVVSMEGRARAYLKIQEGCDRFCSYCIIPYARGGIRSRSEGEILAEAALLVQNGFKELVLTGINTALYGRDRADGRNGEALERLLDALGALPGGFRLRLGSLEPTVVDASGARRLAGRARLCRHLHLSVQSGSATVLARMGRSYGPGEYLAILQSLREADPLYGFTTDIIVGFPGETEEEFRETLHLVEEAAFARVHVFPYSRRKGTLAADMPDQISAEEKKKRAERLKEAADAAAAAWTRRLIGHTLPVLWEAYDEEQGWLEGYADNYARVRCRLPEGRVPEDFLNRIAGVTATSVYNEGVEGTLCGS